VLFLCCISSIELEAVHRNAVDANSRTVAELPFLIQEIYSAITRGGVIDLQEDFIKVHLPCFDRFKTLRRGSFVLLQGMAYAIAGIQFKTSLFLLPDFCLITNGSLG